MNQYVLKQNGVIYKIYITPFSLKNGTLNS